MLKELIHLTWDNPIFMMVAIGSVCRKLLDYFNIYIGSYVSSIYKAKDKQCVFQLQKDKKQ